MSLNYWMTIQNMGDKEFIVRIVLCFMGIGEGGVNGHVEGMSTLRPFHLDELLSPAVC